MTNAVTAYPNPRLIALSLVGHGSGWSANALPGQPTRWGDQPTRWGDQEDSAGGLLWDDFPGDDAPGDGSGSRSMSTRALGIGLKWITDEIGQKIDLLYLDACSMGMIEVAYELRDSVDYMLASPNTAWASFTYDAMLRGVDNTQSAEQVGQAWLRAEAIALSSELYPYTLSLFNLDKVGLVAQAVSQLADALLAAIGNQRSAFDEAYDSTEHYESNYDGAIAPAQDHYADLLSFVRQLETAARDNVTIAPLVQGVMDALNETSGFIIKADVKPGKPWNYENEWKWAEARGVGIYLPLREDDPKRELYTDKILA